MVRYVQIICTKVRDGNNRIVKLKEGDPTGRHVVIVDDLVQSGGTLIECQVSDQHFYSLGLLNKLDLILFKIYDVVCDLSILLKLSLFYQTGQCLGDLSCNEFTVL